MHPMVKDWPEKTVVETTLKNIALGRLKATAGSEPQDWGNGTTLPPPSPTKKAGHLGPALAALPRG